MNILGLHLHSVQSSAALLANGTVVAAAAEERFNRIKLSNDFPAQALRFCLERAGLCRLDQLDAIAVSWNPAENMRHMNRSGFTSSMRYEPEWLYIVPNNLLALPEAGDFSGEELVMNVGARGAPVYFVEHHFSHIAEAVAQCPFERGLAAVVDEYGEFHSVTIALFDGCETEIIKRIAYPNSLGVFFAMVTEYLGYKANADEWKIMGAAAHGDPIRFLSPLEQIFPWHEDVGEWVLDTRYVEHSNLRRGGYANERLTGLIGIPQRRPDEPLAKEHFDLAAAAQAVFEKRLCQLLSFYADSSGAKNLAASGGCFMNSRANGEILAQTPFERLYVSYAPADNGGCIGAAYHVYHRAMNTGLKPPVIPPSPLLGPAYTNEDIEETLRKSKLCFERTDDAPAVAAQSITDGQLVGWFQGKMEFGERALGNRSILGDPRDENVREKVNTAVKFRETFRPFAPSVLAERASEYFDLPPNVVVAYMEQTYPVHAHRIGEIPAVVHADGTARLQMVTRDENPLFHDLISQFDKLTGVPVVLNTSFNIQGEPIVCSPKDAIRTFFSCGLDVLVIGDFVLRK